MARLLGCIAFGIPAGIALFLGIAYVVIIHFDHPSLFEGSHLIYVLVYDGKPIAAAVHMDRLRKFMAAYTPTQQVQMSVTAVEVLK